MWLLAVLLAVATVAVLKWPRRHRQSPPGPTPLPIVGTLAFVAAKNRDQVFDILLGLPRRFGPVVGFLVGSVYNVYVEGAEVARRAMAQPAANGRATEYAQLQLSFGRRRGVIAAEGDRWQRNSRFLLSTLDLMLRSGEMEEMVAAELEMVVKRLNCLQEAVDVSSLFRQPYTSLIWRIVTGDSLPAEEAAALTKMLQAEMTALQNRWINSPLLSRLFPDKTGFSHVVRFRDTVRRMFTTSLRRIRSNDQIKRTFIKEFRALHEATDFKDSAHSWNAEHDEDLVMFVFDFLNAGCETTNAFMEWSILYLLRHPDQQQTLQKEMDALGRPVRASDLPHLPRTQAFIAEVFRRSSLTPAGVPHRATEDLHIEGHLVPQDTVLRYGILADHWSGDLWHQPELFRPQRFLDDEGRVTGADRLCHYGIGPRVCTGRRLADLYTLLTLTSLLQNFQLCLPPGAAPPPETSVMGLVRGCTPFNVVFKRRPAP